MRAQVKTTKLYEDELTGEEARALHAEAVTHLHAFVQGVAARAIKNGELYVAEQPTVQRRVMWVGCEALGSERWDRDFFVVIEKAEVAA